MSLGDYDGNLGRRLRRPIRRRPPLPEDMPDKATADFIKELAARYPRAVPEEIRFFAEEQGRADITSKQVRAVLYRT